MWSLSNPLSLTIPPTHPCQKPLPPSGCRRCGETFQRCLSYAAAALWLAESSHWLSTSSPEENLADLTKRREGGINFKLTCPTGCQSHFRDTEGCRSWQDLTSRGREVTNSITGWRWRRGLRGWTCSRGWLTWSQIYLSTTIGTTGECGRGRGAEGGRGRTGKLSAAQGRKKKEKVAEFRGVNDELLFIKWRETYSGTIQKTEQGDSDLVLQSSQYLHSRRQPWNYTENGIVMSGPLKILVYSHYGAGKEPSSTHHSSVREGECVSAGTAARYESCF